MSANDLELDFLNKKDEYKKEFAIKTLIDLIHDTENEKLYLESEDFKIFFTKVEVIKDMLVNLWKEVIKMKFGKFRFESFKEFQTISNLAVTNGIGTSEEFEKFLKTNYSHKIVK